MTNRQHQLIMSLYMRCDEINAEMDKYQRDATKYIELLGAHRELINLADRFKLQFKAEAEALNKVHSYICEKVNINA